MKSLDSIASHCIYPKYSASICFDTTRLGYAPTLENAYWVYNRTFDKYFYISKVSNGFANMTLGNGLTECLLSPVTIVDNPSCIYRMFVFGNNTYFLCFSRGCVYILFASIENTEGRTFYICSQYAKFCGPKLRNFIEKKVIPLAIQKRLTLTPLSKGDLYCVAFNGIAQTQEGKTNVFNEAMEYLKNIRPVSNSNVRLFNSYASYNYNKHNILDIGE